MQYPCDYPWGWEYPISRGGGGLGVWPCGLPFSRVLPHQPFCDCTVVQGGGRPFSCGQTVRANVLLPGVGRGLGAHALIKGLAGLGAEPGWSIV